MELTNITLEQLLTTDGIRRLKVKNKWYFVKEDLNQVFDNAFQFYESNVIPVKYNDKVHLIPMLSFKEIKDHAQYIKTRPSFGEMIDKVLGTKIKKK